MRQKYQADPKAAQEICEFVRQYEQKFNEHDWVAVAALCTEDAIQIGPEGPVCGRPAIEKKSYIKKRHIKWLTPFPPFALIATEWSWRVGSTLACFRKSNEQLRHSFPTTF